MKKTDNPAIINLASNLIRKYVLYRNNLWKPKTVEDKDLISFIKKYLLHMDYSCNHYENEFLFYFMKNDTIYFKYDFYSEKLEIYNILILKWYLIKYVKTLKMNDKLIDSDLLLHNFLFKFIKIIYKNS